MAVLEMRVTPFQWRDSVTNLMHASLLLLLLLCCILLLLVDLS